MSALRAEVTCPFGLLRSGTTTQVESALTVFPRFHTIGSIDFTHARVYQPGGVPLSASIGESAEFIGLREYRAGDSLRHLCWKAWARSGKPVVREFQGEYFRRVAVVFDTRVLNPKGDQIAFEAAVEVAASLVDYFDRNEFIIDLFAAGPDIYYLQSGMGLSHMEQVLDLLSCVEPSAKDSFPRIDEPLRSLFGRLSGLVLVGADWWSESRDFYASIVTDVPEVKVLLTPSGSPQRDPTLDVEGRMLGFVRPDRVAEDVITL